MTEKKARGFWVQCDRSQAHYVNGKRVTNCEAFTKLPKPGKWRCEACTKRYGAVKP